MHTGDKLDGLVCKCMDCARKRKERRRATQIIRGLRAELSIAKKNDDFGSTMYPASLVEQLLDELDRRSKIHRIEQRLSADRFKKG